MPSLDTLVEDTETKSLSLETLVSDIYNVLDSENDHTPSEDNVEFAGELLKTVLRDRLRVKSDRNPLRFSNLGKPDRQLWYLANAPEKAEKMSPKTFLKFLYGDVIEILMLFLAREAGHDVSMEQHEVSEDGVLGHVDAVIDGVLVDVKSASPYSFNKFKSGDFLFNDPFGYIPQLSGYHHAILKESPGSIDPTRAAFVVNDKVHGDVYVAPLDAETITGNPPGPRIQHIKEVLAAKTPPSRCYSDVEEGKSGNRRLGVECSYCAFKNECWPGLRTFVYSSGPKFLTVVKREPDVPEAKKN